MPPLRKAAIAYAIVIGLAAAWAFVVEARLSHAAGEHLLPVVVLMMATLPSSLSLGAMYEAWPALFSNPSGQVAWLFLCGIGQAGLLFFVAGFMARRGSQ